MKATENDIKLKELLKDFKPESPDKNFTVKLMERIYAEEKAKLKVKGDRIFGIGFWIVIFLFVGILVVYSVFFNAGISSEGSFTEMFNKLLPENASKDYQFLFSKFNSLPLSLAVILFALSILLFIDRVFVMFQKSK